MDAYHHITPTERGRIMTLFEQGHSPAAIAAELNRHRSTILRELKRNRDGESYNADKAQKKMPGSHALALGRMNSRFRQMSCRAIRRHCLPCKN